jgi:hypothetical protein
LDELQFHRFLSAEPNVLPLDVAVWSFPHK